MVPLEVGALVDRLTKGEYDALYFRFLPQDTDPAMNLDFWLSTGGAHVWNIEQPQPATPWEKELDGVMLKMAGARNLAARQQLFYQAQQSSRQPAGHLLRRAARLRGDQHARHRRGGRADAPVDPVERRYDRRRAVAGTTRRAALTLACGVRAEPFTDIELELSALWAD